MKGTQYLPWFEPPMHPKWAKIVADKGQGHYYKKGQVIVSEGDILYHAYYVVKGLVQYQLQTYHGHTRIVCIVGPGRFFGMGPMFDGSPVDNSVETMEGSLIYKLSRNDIFNVIYQDPELTRDIIVNLNSKIRCAFNLIGVLSLMDPKERLIHCLYSIIQSYAVAEDDGWYTIPVELSHAELGEMIGVHRVTVCRILNQWKKLELLKFEKNQMRIRNNLLLKFHKICKPCNTKYSSSSFSTSVMLP